MSEAGYIFTHLASAVAFLTDLSPDQLTDVSPQQFAQSLRECAAAAGVSTTAEEGSAGSGSNGRRLLPARSMLLSQSRRARLWSDDVEDVKKSNDSSSSLYRGSVGGLQHHGSASPHGSCNNKHRNSSSGAVEESNALSVNSLRELSVVELRRARRLRERRPASSSSTTKSAVPDCPSEESTPRRHGQQAPSAATAEECRARYRYLAYEKAEDLPLKEVSNILRLGIYICFFSTS